MHSLTPLHPNPALVAYLEKPLIKSIGFNGFKYSYSVGEHTFYVGGIHSKLKSIYYPEFEVKLRQYRRKGKSNKKKASTKKQGILIDRQLKEYVKSGKKKKPRNLLAQAVVSYIEDHCKSTLQAAQVPVFLKQFGIVTQADLVIQSPKGELLMLELKSGYNSARAQMYPIPLRINGSCSVILRKRDLSREVYPSKDPILSMYTKKTRASL